MNAEELMPYIEPIYRFCRQEAAKPVRCGGPCGGHPLLPAGGSSASAIDSPNAYVWRVARNRYARWIDGRRRSVVLLSEDLPSAVCHDRRSDADAQAFERVFRCLHTLSAAYRDIFVDHYVGGLSVRALADKYALPESTIKWRLYTGREKIKKRVGEQSMDKIYNRIQWNTVTCNGSVDTDRYLHTQLARAICLAAYEKPLTVEEISVQTGVPALYIEDELPRLLHGEAVVKLGEKYATNFILFRLKDAQTVKWLTSRAADGGRPRGDAAAGRRRPHGGNGLLRQQLRHGAAGAYPAPVSAAPHHRRSEKPPPRAGERSFPDAARRRLRLVCRRGNRGRVRAVRTVQLRPQRGRGRWAVAVSVLGR